MRLSDIYKKSDKMFKNCKFNNNSDNNNNIVVLRIRIIARGWNEDKKKMWMVFLGFMSNCSEITHGFRVFCHWIDSLFCQARPWQQLFSRIATLLLDRGLTLPRSCVAGLGCNNHLAFQCRLCFHLDKKKIWD